MQMVAFVSSKVSIIHRHLKNSWEVYLFTKPGLLIYEYRSTFFMRQNGLPVYEEEPIYFVNMVYKVFEHVTHNTSRPTLNCSQFTDTWRILERSICLRSLVCLFTSSGLIFLWDKMVYLFTKRNLPVLWTQCTWFSNEWLTLRVDQL